MRKTKKAIATMLASAIVVGGAFAAEEAISGLAQVYQFKAVVKTMSAAKAKISPSNNPFLDETDTIIYRKPSIVTWYGFIWGCDCETLLGKWKVLPDNPNSVSGAVFWTPKSPYDIILLDDMRWHVLCAVDKSGRRCEVAWTIGESTDDSKAFLSFAGFGTIEMKQTREDGVNDVFCTSYVKSMSGTVSGWMPAPRHFVKGKAALCTFCSIVDSATSDSYETAEVWNFCPCADVGDNTNTAVSGTWALKYNKALSKKLASEKTPTITTAYTKFPASVKKAIDDKIIAIKASYAGQN